MSRVPIRYWDVYPPVVFANAGDSADVTLQVLGDPDTLTWVSDNEDVATVDDGVVTLTGDGGVAVITASETNGPDDAVRRVQVVVVGDSGGGVWEAYSGE